MYPQTEIQHDLDSRMGLRGRFAVEVYRPGARIDLESFNRAHPWVVHEPVNEITINRDTDKPKYLPRRFGSERVAKLGLPFGYIVREEKTLARMQMESAVFLNPYRDDAQRQLLALGWGLERGKQLCPAHCMEKRRNL